MNIHAQTLKRKKKKTPRKDSKLAESGFKIKNSNFLSTFRVRVHPGQQITRRREEKRREEEEEEIGCWTAQFLSRLRQSLEWKPPRRSPLERGSKASWGNVTFSIKHLDITILQENVDVTRTRDKLLSSYATWRTPVSRKVTKSLLPVAEWFITRPRLDLHPRGNRYQQKQIFLSVSAVSNTDPRASD